MTNPRRHLLISLLLFLGLCGLPSLSAVAYGDADPLKQAEKLMKEAMADYDSLEFETAKQTLSTALAKLRDAGMDETPMGARVYIDLAIVYITGDNKDRARGIEQFKKALTIDPAAAIDSDRETPELKAAFEEARKAVAGAGAKPVKPDETEGGDCIKHTPVDDAKAGTKVTIRVNVCAAVGAKKVVLFYRAGGQEEFVATPLDNQGGHDWVGEIPSDAVTGKSVQYYLEARDGKDKAVIAANSAASPYIIVVTTPKVVEQREDGEVPPGTGHKQEEPSNDRGYGRIYLDVMAGTGIGVEPAGNHTEVAFQYTNDGKIAQYRPQPIGQTGVAFAPFHIGVELGARISKAASISAIGRFQLVTGGNADSFDNADNPTMGPNLGMGTHKASGAVAGQLRFRYMFGGGNFHPYVHIDAGGGQVRHELDISLANDVAGGHPLVDGTTANVNNPNLAAAGPAGPVPMGSGINQVCPKTGACVDTIAMGFVLVGGGAGIWYDLTTFTNGGVGLVLDINAMFALGDQSGFNVDIQAGVGIHFL